MASHDDLMCMIKSLLESLDKLGSSFSLVKSVADRLTAVEENMCSSQDVKKIADRLTNLEQKVALLSTSEEVKIIAERQAELEDKMCTSEEANVISERLTILEHKVSTSEEVKIIENRLARIEENMSSDHCTGSRINKEPSVKPLRFHTILKGENVKITNDFQTAERLGPRDNYAVAGVVSQRPLCDGEVFRFRIDERIGLKMSMGLAFGVIRSPTKEIMTSDTITLKIPGTWAILGSPLSHTATSSTFKDSCPMTKDSYPLQTTHLSIGTVLGVSRRENGDLHFYINGVDKGVAFTGVPKDVHAFVDIIEYVTKISIVN